MPVTINASTSSGLVQSADTSGQIELQTNGTTVATVNTSNNVQFRSAISVGNATPTTSGAGITFPATQSASTDANTLDDYEEGTFTPTLVGGFSSAPTGYTNQQGHYTKIGDTVFITIDLNPDGAVANATQIRIGGLPFVAKNVPEYAAPIAYQVSFNTNAGDTIATGGTTTILYFYTSTGGNRDGNSAGVNINNRVIVSLFYKI